MISPKCTEFKIDTYDRKKGSYILNIVGGEANDGQEIYALYPKPDGGYYNLGKLLVVSYPEYKLKVKIIPLFEGFSGDFSNVKSRLESIYKRVGIDCEVTEGDYFSYADPLLFEKGSGLLSAYNAKMKALNAAYAVSHDVDASTSYIFILGYSGQGSDRNFSGFMPLNSQFGYVSRHDFRSMDKFCIAVAHELAHGRLSLRHPFDSSLGLEEGDVAENLMDYKDGTELAKWQWDVVHDPGVVMRVFERDKDAMIGPILPFPSWFFEWNKDLYVALNKIFTKDIGIEFVPLLTYKDKIPYVDGVGDSFRVGKNYTLKPYFLKDQIIFYLAERIYGGKTFLDWIISPNSLDEFKKRESTDIPIITDSYSDKAFNLYRYLLYYEHYDWYESVLKLWSGDSKALATLSLRNLKEQWKNPENWIVSADIYLRWVSALKGAERLKVKSIIGESVRVPYKGLKNIFVATPNEVAGATVNIKNYRIKMNNKTGGNYGYLEGEINGKILENKMWRSGKVEAVEPQIFIAKEVRGASGRSWLRNTDSEYKMLNKLANDLDGHFGEVYLNVRGELKIVSENPFCESCQEVIFQFNQMYPNIKLILINGAK